MDQNPEFSRFFDFYVTFLKITKKKRRLSNNKLKIDLSL